MIKDLKDLFVYLIQNLHASEVQMLTALPAIIEKAQHHSLQNALNHHLNLTKE